MAIDRSSTIADPRRAARAPLRSQITLKPDHTVMFPPGAVIVLLAQLNQNWVQAIAPGALTAGEKVGCRGRR